MRIKNNTKVKIALTVFTITVLLISLVIALFMLVNKTNIIGNNITAKNEYEIILHDGTILTLDDVVSSTPNEPILGARYDTNKMG